MILLAMRLRALRNTVARKPTRYLVGALVLALLGWGLLLLTRRAVRFLDALPGIGAIADAVARRSLEGLLLVLLAGVAFSVLTTAIATLFDAHDLPFLLAQPIPATRVFALKVVETYAQAALLPALFTVPVLLGFGLERQAPLGYYPLALLAVLLLFSLPVGLGGLLALLLMRFAPAGRVKETATAASVLAAAGLVLGLRLLRPERLAEMDLAAFERLLGEISRFEVGWLPSTWASAVVWEALDGRLAAAAGLLAAAAVALLGLLALAAAGAYRQGWFRGLDAVPRTRRRRRSAQPTRLERRAERWLRHLGSSGAIALKDLRSGLRDPSQWSQLLVLAALAGVYLVSTGSIRVEQQRFRDALGALNIAYLGLLLAGVGVRTAFPAVSLEGEGWWLLRTGPLRSRTVVAAKFMAALPAMMLLGGGLGLVSAQLLDLSPSLAFVAPLAGLCAALATTGLGVGLGAAFPRFAASSPAEIPVSLGGLLYMASALGYALLATLILAYPAWRALQEPGAAAPVAFWWSAEGVLVLTLLVGLTAVATLLPLIWGSARLARYEPGSDG